MEVGFPDDGDGFGFRITAGLENVVGVAVPVRSPPGSVLVGPNEEVLFFVCDCRCHGIHYAVPCIVVIENRFGDRPVQYLEAMKPDTVLTGRGRRNQRSEDLAQPG